ncbi:nucleotidyltransferase domain-containing protein [Leptolyngbya cf. ectocarpi LEGE 11479]|uniref:Nucleotidyltransferase domain-containing protein n=1 Tax=Leptolyngbya cf. ectocarpi LEGE 11479 TaxID=1828722 RepID=A0A928ZYU4_LEPEC|nr:nucleotidyltransferase domain-containing protein [Leptolyngbya ectocarpi]MBE9069931.1 nucleotidyltransferase domain-containing protein [Leptolyngbya cf. ectocarpi LEGE 11479]
MKHPQLDIILEKVKQFLSDLYQEKLQSIILYGSQARGDSRLDSDIDILVVLSEPVNPYHEIDRTGYFIAHLCLEFDVVISRHFISAEKFQAKNTPFLANVGKEGIAV